MNSKSNKKSSNSYQLFIAGHCNSDTVNHSSIQQAFAAYCEGRVKVDIPGKKWKGFCFVYVYNKTDLKYLIDKEEIIVNGQVLAIKPHKKGNRLEKSK